MQQKLFSRSIEKIAKELCGWHRVLTEGGGSKLGFRDENAEIDLWLNS
jgi:hypothetical protein